MKAFFSPSFATKLSIYVLSFTLIVFVCIMMLFYNYSRKQITEDAIDHAHGLLRNTATQISGELQIVESTLEQSVLDCGEKPKHPRFSKRCPHRHREKQ